MALHNLLGDLATDAKLTAVAGSAGDNAPPLAVNATGLYGWLRKVVDTLARGSSAATSTPVQGVATSAKYTPTAGADVTAGAPSFVIGPFTPQIAREIWLTLIGTAAVGTAQLLRSTDGGGTKSAITDGTGNVIGAWAFGSGAPLTGPVVNAQIFKETDAAATLYLAVALSAGSLTYRAAQ